MLPRFFLAGANTIIRQRRMSLCPDNQEWSILQLSVITQLLLMLCVLHQMVRRYDFFSHIVDPEICFQVLPLLKHLFRLLFSQ